MAAGAPVFSLGGVTAVSDFREMVTDFATELRTYFSVVVVDVLSGGIALWAADGVKNNGRVVTATNRCELLAVIKTIQFEQLFPVGRRWPSPRCGTFS